MLNNNQDLKNTAKSYKSILEFRVNSGKYSREIHSLNNMLQIISFYIEKPSEKTESAVRNVIKKVNGFFK